MLPPFPTAIRFMAGLALAFVAFSLAGCMVGPDFRRPDVSAQLPEEFSVPEGWKLADPRDDQPRGEWWRCFDSDQLDTLIGKAHDQNQDLAAAVARVEQARALSAGARSAWFPTIDFSPSAYRQRRSGTISNTARNLAGVTTTNLSLPFTLDYEIDFWGELRRAIEAAEAETLASEATRRQLALSIESELAAQYFTLRGYDSEIALYEEAVDLRNKSLDLNRKRFKAGDTDEVDVSRAETELAATEGDLIGLRQSRDETEHAIAVLVGEPASAFQIARNPLGGNPPSVGISPPTELLERRPDIAAAERIMMAENARIGIAKAAFFPSVRFSATAGLESGGTAHLFDYASRTWGLGPEVSLPIFDAGRNQAGLKRAEARYDETVAQYRKTVLDAVEEVENALSAIRKLEDRIAAQERTVNAAARTVELSRRRYDAGVVAYFEVVDAQRTELDAKRLLVRFQAARYLASIALVKALGGEVMSDQ
ncbi:MAG: efflux transporter outer membrane subunit [Verrucomicrobiae bacterium]|nr:efflux transporter outer membrane subunit [Verrucomicrobiae bacterium]